MADKNIRQSVSTPPSLQDICDRFYLHLKWESAALRIVGKFLFIFSCLSLAFSAIFYLLVFGFGAPSALILAAVVCFVDSIALFVFFVPNFIAHKRLRTLLLQPKFDFNRARKRSCFFWAYVFYYFFNPVAFVFHVISHTYASKNSDAIKRAAAEGILPDEKLKAEKSPSFVHIAKRDDLPAWAAWLIRVGTILLALLAVGVVSTLLTGENIGEIYSKMFLGTFGRVLEGKFAMVWTFLQDTAILLCLSLAVTPAFKMKFWNCGAEGQALAGGLAAIVCMMKLGGKVPEPLLIAIVVAAAVLAGALWGLIPAIFKAQYGTNETLFTLMMNYIVTKIVSYYVGISSGGSQVIQPVLTGALPVIGGEKYLLNILVVAVLTVLMFIYLRFSKQGYEIAVVGESQNTARYIGINVKKVILRTMVISGALCGVAGLLLVAGTNHTINTDTVGGQGFTAIMISWLGQFNPFIMALMSGLLTFLQSGSAKVADSFFLNSSFADIVAGIVILALVGCEFFVRYTVKFRHGKKGGKTV